MTKTIKFSLKNTVADLRFKITHISFATVLNIFLYDVANAKSLTIMQQF